MAESKTKARGSGAAKTSKGTAKAGKEAAKGAKAPAKTAKPAAGTSKAPAKAAKAPAKAAKAPAKAPKATAKAAKAPAKAVKAPAGASKGSAKAAKDAARAAKVTAKPARKVTARTAGDAAKATATPPPPAPAAAKPTAPRPPAKRKVVQDTARSYFDAVAARDAATMAAHWHREGIYDSVPLGVFRGPDAVRRLYQEMFAAMPDMRTTVERITADDRVAAVQWRASGTFSGGPFQGIEPTGRQIEVRGIDSLEVDDGKILRNTSVYDGAAVARGMGLLPAEDSGADRAMRAGFNTVTKLRRVMAARTGGGQ
jgi:steroid delta-isomerase-like uncharacterized protein